MKSAFNKVEEFVKREWFLLVILFTIGLLVLIFEMF